MHASNILLGQPFMQDSSSVSEHPPEFPSPFFGFFCCPCCCFLFWPLIERFPEIGMIWLVNVTRWFLRGILLLAMPTDYRTTLSYRSHLFQKIALFFWQFFPHRPVSEVAVFPVAAFLALVHPSLRLIQAPWKIIKSMDDIYEIYDNW